MKEALTIEVLKAEAKEFCEYQSAIDHNSLFGITDGKAIGTYIEHTFKEYLQSKYIFNTGSSAIGIDFPDSHINTDIKVTSTTQPQSSCPFRTPKQKIYGLGYNLLIFVYEKYDQWNTCKILFRHCVYIDKSRTSDFTTTKRLREMVNDGANKEDIISYLTDRNLPGDENLYNELADEILKNTPEQGYITISNALQWRLQYSRVITLDNTISGITNYVW